MNPRKEYGKMKWSNHGTCAAPNGCPVKNLEKGQGESWRQLQLCNPSDEQWKNVAEKQGAEDVIAVGKCMQHRSLVNPLSELDTYPTMMGKLQSRLHHPARRIEDLGRDASITLGFVDGQRFKKINDEYNHQAGNDVIRDIARVLKELMREQDLVAHCSGDEFAFAWPRLSEERAHERLQEVSKVLRRGHAVTTVSGLVSWKADLVGVYLPGPLNIDDVHKGFTYADEQLGDWKRSPDRESESPPLLLPFPRGALSSILDDSPPSIIDAAPASITVLPSS